ncbi:MAG: hypothetical protein OXD54_06745 [Candidatus Poribacteria bacterium]|nr:hypothetical protein [Candidatus Poribacteria bacterium]
MSHYSYHLDIYNSAINTHGKLTAHATAKKSKKDKRFRCLAKSISDDIKIVNGWWGMTIQIDDTTWNRPTESESPQYKGKIYRRMYKRERTHKDKGYSWAYISGVNTNGDGFYPSNKHLYV